MLLKEYYFLTSALPPLEVGAIPGIRFEEYLEMLRTNLSKSDWKKVEVIRRLYDLENISFLLHKTAHSPFGNLDRQEIEEAFRNQEGLPSYILDFWKKYDAPQDKKKYFSRLYHDYFSSEIKLASGFIKRFLVFERSLRLVLLALRAKELKKDCMQELQFENPDDELVAHILSQKDAPHYEPQEEFIKIKELYEGKKASALDLQKALICYRFDKIEELYEGKIFSLERLLAYLAQLILVEQWQYQDQKKGESFIHAIVKELS